jgi:hypothetical protein
MLTRNQAILSPLLIFAATFRTIAALSVINQPRMPIIKTNANANASANVLVKGHERIGSRVLRLPSGTRVRLFYPTIATLNSAQSGNSKSNGNKNANMAPYCTDGRQTSNGMAGLVGFRQLGLSFLLAHLASASSGCILDAPFANVNVINAKPNVNVKGNVEHYGDDLDGDGDDNKIPLLIYSHGYGGNMDMATYFFRTMASKGIIIAAVEHTDGTASSTVLEDGSERRFNTYFMTGRQQLTRRASELLEAVEFLPKVLLLGYETLKEEGSDIDADVDSESMQVQVGTIMLGGHSYGAPSAIMAANGSKLDPITGESKIEGVILHDPALGMGYGMLPPNGSKSKVPTISYLSDEYHKANVQYGDLTLHVKGCRHGNFVDAPLWAPMWIMRPLSLLVPAAGSADPVLVHEELAESASAFLQSRDPTSPDVRRVGGLFEFVR